MENWKLRTPQLRFQVVIDITYGRKLSLGIPTAGGGPGTGRTKDVLSFEGEERAHESFCIAIIGSVGCGLVPQAGIDPDCAEPRDPDRAFFIASLFRVILGEAHAAADRSGVFRNRAKDGRMAVVAQA